MPLSRSDPLQRSVIGEDEVAGSCCMLEVGGVISTAAVPIATTALRLYVSRRRTRTGRSPPSRGIVIVVLSVTPVVALSQGLQVRPSVLQATAVSAAAPVEALTLSGSVRVVAQVAGSTR